MFNNCQKEQLKGFAVAKGETGEEALVKEWAGVHGSEL